jgi:hypothetical protein
MPYIAKMHSNLEITIGFKSEQYMKIINFLCNIDNSANNTQK